MDKYEIMLYPKALRDIDDIYAYVALEKLSPENAKEQTDRIFDVKAADVELAAFLNNSKP